MLEKNRLGMIFFATEIKRMKLINQTAFYRGKVRDVYTIKNNYVVMVASNRISAFDVILPKAIPFKGQVLNQVAIYFLEATKSIVPNWFIASPAPNVSIGLWCTPYPVEMVIRGHLSGHAWRTYQSGTRTLCGVTLPEGMKENDSFPEPIITPSTKAHEGHDEDITREEIIARGLISEAEYTQLETHTRNLFQAGQQMARERGLILVDTKYEFGNHNGTVYLIDEIHTPDSSRYFIADGFDVRQEKGEKQKQLSKEFVREWLIAHDFMGKEGQTMPLMPDEFVDEITKNYIHLYEQLTNQRFEPLELSEQETEDRINAFLQTTR
jgi:phosphoribosylaminoimidazole-succinocarboxamide synthase